MGGPDEGLPGGSGQRDVAEFKFNFGSCDSTKDAKTGGGEKARPQRPPACELKPEFGQHVDVDAMERLALSDNVDVRHATVDNERAAELLANEHVKDADLVPGEYEGGFKLWECSVDLAKYMLQMAEAEKSLFVGATPDNPYYGGTIMELGCGHGIPGIVAALLGAEVHFQDYNSAVLTSLTMPNLVANRQSCGPKHWHQNTRWFAGDWRDVTDLLEDLRLTSSYDLILTAETIYEQSSHDVLIATFKRLLKPPHAKVLIAAKSHYFGVGGGVASFKRAVKRDGTFECATVWSCEDGSSNKREILQLRFPASVAPFFQ